MFNVGDFKDLTGGRQYYINQNLTIDQNTASQAYLSPNPISGSLYSMSQNMNYKLNNGMKLNAQEDYTYKQMMSAMHPLGKDIKLTRYDHETYINGILSSIGVKGSYDKLSDTQLRQALVGQTVSHKGMLSTSYNDFKNAGSNPFDSRAVKLTYLAKGTTHGYMIGKGAGGDLGEIVLSPSVGQQNNAKIIDVRYTGKKARIKGTQNYSAKQIEIILGIE